MFLVVELITEIWPLLGNLETLEIKSDYSKDINIDTIKQEFPKIPGLKIIEFKDFYL
jgi:hypothetical protein